MQVEKVYKSVRYRLSNDNLKVGEKVYPIANGRCLPDNTFILHGFDFRDFCSGFPDEPHTIEKLDYSKDKPYEVRTDHGYSPIECYYKIIKREHQIRIVSKHNSSTLCLDSYEWVECDEATAKLVEEYHDLEEEIFPMGRRYHKVDEHNAVYQRYEELKKLLQK